MPQTGGLQAQRVGDAVGTLLLLGLGLRVESVRGLGRGCLSVQVKGKLSQHPLVFASGCILLRGRLRGLVVPILAGLGGGLGRGLPLGLGMRIGHCCHKLRLHRLHRLHRLRLRLQILPLRWDWWRWRCWRVPDPGCAFCRTAIRA